jgi:prolyl-tRNA synthetase
LKSDATSFIKTLIYQADGKPIAVLLRGDHTANEGKIRRATKARQSNLPMKPRS